jgi:hypothetical protein
VGIPGQARLALLDRLTRVDPALDHESRTMRTIAGMGAYILQIAYWVTLVLGGLALALTVSGLFSVLSYLVEQRAKEIGVRMALGATTKNIPVLVLSQSARPVGFGLLAGGGLAAGLAIVLMSTPAAPEIGKTVRVFDPMAYVASLLVIVTACVQPPRCPPCAPRASSRSRRSETTEAGHRASCDTGLRPHRAGQPVAGIVPNSHQTAISPA